MQKNQWGVFPTIWGEGAPSFKNRFRQKKVYLYRSTPQMYQGIIFNFFLLLEDRAGPLSPKLSVLQEKMFLQPGFFCVPN